MTPDQQFVVAMVTIVAGVLTTAITAVYSAKKAMSNGSKLDEIHVLVNSNLTDVKKQLLDAMTRLDTLQRVINSGQPLIAGEPLVSGAAVQAVLDAPAGGNQPRDVSNDVHVEDLPC